MTETRDRMARAALVMILAGSALLKLPNLGHDGLNYFDEAFHAVVAKNLVKHPLEPTLVEAPALAYEVSDWGRARVWLHKPTLTLWIIAASYRALGVSTLALRLPSVALSTGAVLLTYLIGRSLFGRRAGLVAAAIQAANPVVAALVQGYLFADHVDIGLLVFVELGVYLLVRAAKGGSHAWAAGAGVAQGLAYLSKSYPAAIVGGLAATLWLLPRLGPARRGEWRLSAAQLATLSTATLATVAPWTAYCLACYPGEYHQEHGYVLAHLGSPLEGWGAPWDRLAFDYADRLAAGFYAPALVAAAFAAARAVRGRSLAHGLVLAWAAGVFAPHLAAATKTPTATLIALPALALLVGALAAEAWEGRPAALAAWAAVVALGAARVGSWPDPLAPWGRGPSSPPLAGGVMLANLRIAGHVAAALALAALAGRSGPPTGARLRALRAVGAAGMILLAGRGVWASAEVTRANRTDRPLAEGAARARGRLPGRPVLIFDGPDRGEHLAMMFLTDWPCYHARGRVVEDLACEVRRNGGTPYRFGRPRGDGGPPPRVVGPGGSWAIDDLPEAPAGRAVAAAAAAPAVTSGRR